MSTEPTTLAEDECRPVMRHMPTMTPGYVLADLIRDVEQIITARLALVTAERNRLRDTLARVEVLVAEYENDEREHLDRFGHHHPVAWDAARHLRAALAGGDPDA